MTELEGGFRLDGVEVRPLEGLIAGPAGGARVEPKAMAVLVELARHAGEVCSREQVQQAVWPRGFTTDDVLTRCIGQLRKALGDDPKSPRHLETLPRRGYRLLTRPQPLDATAAQLLAAGDDDGPERLIVMPFQYLARADDDYIADGMTELLTARLAVLRGIRVISRTTAMRFKGMAVSLGEVASQTGAHWVVEGSVLQSGNRVQVVVQLIDARTDAHLWADDYVRDIGDMLLLQNEIVKRVAVAIRIRVGADEIARPAAPKLAPDAMRDYLLGRHLLSKRSADALQQAIDCFSRVCEASPDYAAAWASRAEARFMLCHYGAARVSESAPLCRDDVDQALSLDPDIAIGLTCRGVLRLFLDRDYPGAERDLLRALAVMPGYSLAMLSLANVCAVQQRFDEASGWLDQALLVDPLDVGINMNIGDHRILQRRFDDAVSALDKALALAPGHRPSLLRRCWALALAGHAEAADTALASIGPTGDDDWQWLEYAALVAAAGGDNEAAGRHWSTLERLVDRQFISPWSLARAAAAASAHGEAITWLGKAVESGSTSLPFLAVTPAFDGLRDREDFRSLLT